jgi:CRP/FNR family transcriptional regulator
VDGCPAGPVRVAAVPVEIARHRLFEDLTQDDLTYLMGFARIQAHSKYDVLFAQGEPCEGLFILLQGVVRLYKSSANGREHVVEVIRSGQSFAEAAVFADVPYPVFAQTLEPSRVLFLPKAPYLAFLRENPTYLFDLIASLSARMHQLVVKVERLTLRDAVQRVAGLLLDMSDDGKSVALDVTKATVASQLALTPETLSRAFATLQEQGLVTMSGSRFQLHDCVALQTLMKGEVNSP